ncbi:MAG: S-methyl-5-thioribose-1-phosphate isomerase, partial [Vicinamibacteria bacterium]|nr:S-methyl-5-thioribose-1-phosphate isomerase [Vicinamibacteria bacterium]
MVDTVRWEDGRVVMIDQRLLPGEVVLLRCAEYGEVAHAIERLAVRGAPAIGVSAAYGLALAASRAPRDNWRAVFSAAGERFAATRPTAVNLFWAIERMRQVAAAASNDQGAACARLLQEARAIHEEDLAACHAIGDHGAPLLPQPARVLTHCNAGALATAGYGTALGVIRSAARLGRIDMVFADETRPVLQGA